MLPKLRSIMNLMTTDYEKSYYSYNYYVSKIQFDLI